MRDRPPAQAVATAWRAAIVTVPRMAPYVKHVLDPDLSAADARTVRANMRKWVATQALLFATAVAVATGDAATFVALLDRPGTASNFVAWLGVMAMMAVVMVAIAVFAHALERDWDTKDGKSAALTGGLRPAAWAAIRKGHLEGGPEHHRLWTLAQASKTLAELERAGDLAQMTGQLDAEHDAARRVNALAATLHTESRALCVALGVPGVARVTDASDLLAKIPDPVLV